MKVVREREIEARCAAAREGGGRVSPPAHQLGGDAVGPQRLSFRSWWQPPVSSNDASAIQSMIVHSRLWTSLLDSHAGG
ncbi:hypothetical protein NL676_023406 [Syzygium grande]|nr:hypothetical protein NL676_023406 [Syzygium grande]